MKIIPKFNRKSLKAVLAKNPDMLYRDIAKKFGVSIQWVNQLARELGFSRKPRVYLTAEAKKELLDYIVANPKVAFPKVAEKFGVSAGFVAKFATDNGVHRSAVDHEARRRAVLDYVAKHPDARTTRIADELGLGLAFVSNLLEKEIGREKKSRPKIDMEKFAKEMKENPWRSLKDLANMFGVTTFAISIAKQRLRRPKEPAEPPKRGKKIDWEKIWPIIEKNRDRCTIKQLSILTSVSTSSLNTEIRKRKAFRGPHRKMDYADVTRTIQSVGYDKAVEILCERYDVGSGSVMAAATKLGLYHPKPSAKRNPVNPKAVVAFWQEQHPVSLVEAAGHFGISAWRTARILSEAGVWNGRKGAEYDREAAANLLKKKDGLSCREIAAIVGTSASSIMSLAKKLGIPRPRSRSRLT